MRTFFVLVGMLLVALVTGGIVVQQQLPEMKALILEVTAEAREAGTNPEKWDAVTAKAERLPSVFPVSAVKSSVVEVQNILAEVEQLKEQFPLHAETKIRITPGTPEPQKIVTFAFFERLESIENSLEKIERNLQIIPGFLLEEEEKLERQKLLELVRFAKKSLQDIRRFEGILQKFAREEERVVILLQNQNEPRSTGGFLGSLVVVDFAEDGTFSWDFEDIYAIDRLIDVREQIPSPGFFHGLSQTISLRDANFWPDFPRSATTVQNFFQAAGQRRPGTVLAVNLNVAEEILKLTGPIEMPQWNLTLDAQNFDVMLQFLVESKIAGRMNVKDPVMYFAQALLAPERVRRIAEMVLTQDPHVQKFDLEQFIAQKNLLAFSESRELQRLFEKWGLAGRVELQREADNFLLFDFVSIGANKSEKFVWTKLRHDSKIQADGWVQNTVKIVRNHALRYGELSQLLQESRWPEERRALLTQELWWKLGYGQNRTVLRLWVPRGAELREFDSPSGTIEIGEQEEWKIFEIPMNVLPGERLEIELTYDTRVQRGSRNWRPYNLQLVGTPGREKTELLTTISPVEGTFKAETYNIGRPVDLVDQNFRAVVEFE